MKTLKLFGLLAACRLALATVSCSKETPGTKKTAENRMAL